uniref:Pept_C1 domain-containing protein n=1 Tax=Panagrellus redivivus TaxID=6233 RepID=A0A7E4ZYL0_PANRE
MLTVVLLVTLFPGTITVSINKVDGLHDQAFVDEINAKQTTWIAKFNERFATPEARQAVLGLADVTKTPGNVFVDDYNITDDEIPESFDARQQWPRCESIGHIRDQAACLSCWAVSAAAVMSDRTCIASNGTLNVSISADDLMECSPFCGYGCEPCWPYFAMLTMAHFGAVTGGDHNSNVGCKPYLLPNQNNPRLPGCVRKCQNSYETLYEDDKHYALQPYYVSGIKNWQKEIMTNGPAVVGFQVEQDFVHYSSGVYSHGESNSTANHAVKLLGWGVEDGTPYWLCANSWGSKWGDHGYFKIRRGSNDCNLESNYLTAASAKIVKK